MTATREILLQDWRERLRGWSADGSLASAARHALELGPDDPPLLTQLTGQWTEGDFLGLPPIVLLPSSSMPGVAGAYAISTGAIYLNEDWLKTASDERVIAVLTEELGHHLDALLNSTDTPGDEGEVFSASLMGLELFASLAKLSGQEEIHLSGEIHPIAIEASSTEWYTPAYQLSDSSWGDVLLSEQADLMTVSLWERQWNGWSSGSEPLNSGLETEIFLDSLNSIYIPYELADTVLTFYGRSSAPMDDQLWWSDDATDSSSLIVDINSIQSYGDVKWEVARVSTYSNQSFDDWEIEEIDNYILDSKNPNIYSWDYMSSPGSPPVLGTSSNLDVSGITWSTVGGDDYYPRYDFYELGKGDLLYLSPTFSGSSHAGYGLSYGAYPVLRIAAQQTGGDQAQVLLKDVGSVIFDPYIDGGPGEPYWLQGWVAAPSVPDLHPDHDSGISDSDNLTNDSSPRFTGTHEEVGFTIELFANGASLGTAVSEYGSYPADWSFSVAPSAELGDGTYSITAKATDFAGITSSESLALTLTVDTTAPTFTSGGTAAAIDENSGAAQIIHTAASTDDSSVSYSLTADNNDDATAFSIDSLTGEVTLTADPDYESQSAYAFTVVATDAAGNSSKQQVELTVNDLDETPPNTAPTDLSITASAFDENITAGTSVGTLSTTDSDAGDTFTYSLVSGSGDTDNNSFTIDGDELKIKESPDFEAKSSYSIRVETKDSGGLTFEKAFGLTVNNIVENTDPVITFDYNSNHSLTNKLVGNVGVAGTELSFNLNLADGDGSDDNYLFYIDNGKLYTKLDSQNILVSTIFKEKSIYSIRVIGSRYSYDPIYKNLTFTYADNKFNYVGDDSPQGQGNDDDQSGRDSRQILDVDFDGNLNFSDDDTSIGNVKVNNIEENLTFDVQIVNQDLGDTLVNQYFYVDNRTIYINDPDLLRDLLERRGAQGLSIILKIEANSQDKAYQEIKFENTGEQLKLLELIDRTEELVERLETLVGAIYRFYNVQSGVHFYTPSDEEKGNILNNPDWGYQYEGVAYQALSGGGVELFRFYNAAKKYHFLTKNPEEAQAIIRNSVGENFDLITGAGQEPVPGGWGYKYEGRTYRVAGDETEEYSTPVYRFFQPQKSVHFYSSSLDEVKNVIKMSSGEQYMNDLDGALNAPLLENGWGYQLEGVAWWI